MAFDPAFLTNINTQLGSFLPSLLGAILILIAGWVLAAIAASITKRILLQTNLDNRLASTFLPAGSTARPHVEQWGAALVFWVIMIFAIVAFLNALRLDVVSQPLNNFLQQIFSYLPRLGGAAILVALAWVLASLVKVLVTRGLARFGLDEKLNVAPKDAEAGAADPYVAARSAEVGVVDPSRQPAAESPFLLSETLGNVLYWFVFLFFLPLILDVLQLQGPLQPVQTLLNDFLVILPRILSAIAIGAAGWFIAQVVRNIVTNLLRAARVDRLGTQFGLSRTQGALSLSSLIGTLVYVLILIPTAIAALQALGIRAISDPAIAMLNDILTALPRIFTAAVLLIVFYVIGRFIADLVTNLLTSFGFNNVFEWMGLPRQTVAAVSPPPSSPPYDATPGGEPTVVQPAATLPRRTPSEIVGILALVGIMLFAAVAAAEVLQFQQLTAIVNGILAVSARVLVGVIVFGVGLYLANLAFNLIAGSGGRQARILAQAARIAIIALVSAMALQQMGIATNIVALAFGLLLGAIAVALAIAFGLGGREVAAEQLREWLASFKQQS
ncbi:mechanosensitive ion channel [Thermoleptolyngbya oregonensis NK1-22]|uniref:Mechanosensitive ion channel n=1 Tax=Thermoleptolyngbya oregonensis NK1-22 TaxID=2547457 RepID=A0AA97BLU4_9CYAN|nr:mechanosensitive ion channel [Thermoleptolyngbya oregonensis]WOB43572.1 mechanosensitive ion channel [Thermoleptolyngbya oregonensis NK1-22]